MTATAHELGVSSPRRKTRWVFVALELIIAINAVGGSIWGLSGAKDVPREWLDGTPFDSYVVPSLILLVGVGGGMSAAAAALALRRPLAPEVNIAAGLVLVGWIAVQVLIIVPDGGFSWLQPAMLAAGVFVAGFGWRLRRQREERVGKPRSGR
jgi:hypothetical protein